MNSEPDSSLTRQLQGGLALRCLIFQRAECSTADQILPLSAAHREEVSCQTVAVSDGACLVQDHGIHVTAGFYCLTRHGNDIKPGNTVHTRNADSGQQRADGGRRQAHEQRHQRGDSQRISRAVLRGGYLDVLITDEPTAALLLKGE